VGVGDRHPRPRRPPARPAGAGHGTRAHLAPEARRRAVWRCPHGPVLRPPAPETMRILYVASDQRVPGCTGGSVHVLEVARGLAARGHEVHAVVHRNPGSPDLETDGRVTWHRIEWTPDHRLFRFRARPRVAAIA